MIKLTKETEKTHNSDAGSMITDGSHLLMGSNGAQGLCCFERISNGGSGVGSHGHDGGIIARVELRVDSSGELGPKGRTLWASEHLRAGEVVFSNLPCAHVLTGQYLESRCSHCLCSAPEGDILSQCGKCKFVRYW